MWPRTGGVAQTMCHNCAANYATHKITQKPLNYFLIQGYIYMCENDSCHYSGSLALSGDRSCRWLLHLFASLSRSLSPGVFNMAKFDGTWKFSSRSNMKKMFELVGKIYFSVTTCGLKWRFLFCFQARQESCSFSEVQVKITFSSEPGNFKQGFLGFFHGMSLIFDVQVVPVMS